MCHGMTQCCARANASMHEKIDIPNENFQLHLMKINIAMILAIAVVGFFFVFIPFSFLIWCCWCSWTNDRIFLKCCHHTLFDSVQLAPVYATNFSIEIIFSLPKYVIESKNSNENKTDNLISTCVFLCVLYVQVRNQKNTFERRKFLEWAEKTHFIISRKERLLEKNRLTIKWNYLNK